MQHSISTTYVLSSSSLVSAVYFDNVGALRQFAQNGDGFFGHVANFGHQHLRIGRGDDDVVGVNNDKPPGFTGLHTFESVGNELEGNFQIQHTDRRAILFYDATE